MAILGIIPHFFISQNMDDGDSVKLYDDLNEISLLKAGYEPSRGGSGLNIEVVAHQSYVNDSFDTEFSNLSLSGDFNVPCPTETSFNSSLTNFTIEDIFAPDKELIIED